MSELGHRELQLPIAALALAIAAAGGAVYYSGALHTEAQRQLAQQESRLREARTQLQRSGDEQDVIVRFLGSYRDLQRLGFAGDEQRINWLDGLRIANEQADLFGVDYQISAQAPYAHAGELKPGDIALRHSVMNIRFRLLHEEDLPRFFNALRDAGAGVFAIDECTVRRADATGVIRYQPNLAAECKLSWITAQPRRVDAQP